MLAASLTLALAQATAGISRADVELVGPLDSIEVALPGGSTTVIASLARGERRRIVVPIPARAGVGQPAVRVLEDVGGSAELAGPVDRDEDASWAALPAGLRARPRGVPEREDGDSPTRPALSALLVAFAWLPLGWSLRTRRIALLGSALATAALLAVLVASVASAGTRVRVTEGDLAHGSWVEVQSSRRSVAVWPSEVVRVESDPAATVTSVATLDALSRGPWLVDAPSGAVVSVFSRFDPGDRTLSPAVNRWEALNRVWTRSAGGEWSSHGRWPRGGPLPPGRNGAGADPPGWLNPALPMGTGILIARCETGGVDAAGRPLETWLRVTGFGD